ncbi:MAG: DUF6261 family protein [Tannerellaceae bacterium]|nr:DUF6261 family protein [Tannerellaceae bacterium]
MKIIRIPLQKLHNEEWFELFNVYKEKVNRFGSETLGIKDLYLRFLSLLYKADAALLILRKSSYTKAIEAADKQRDELYQGFYGTVKSARKQPNADKQQAAERLFELLKGYRGDITSGNHAAESGAIYNLLQDLRSASYTPDVTLLGVGDWIAAISQAEQSFLSYSALRDKEHIDKPRQELKLLRAEINVLYTAMAAVMDSKLLGDGLGGNVNVDREDLDTDIHEDSARYVFTPETHGNITYNFVVDWNQTVSKYHQLLEQRATKQANREEDEDDNTAPIED